MNNPAANTGRPWTPQEDKLLTEAVRIHGDNTERWKTIALSVPGRTNKACRKRWLHSLSPTVKKCAWTQEEDQRLLSLFDKHPNKWSQIARGIPGRTDDACSKRYREALDPKLKRDDWTEEEDVKLLETYAKHGGPTNPKWGVIGQELGRSGLGCRNRWRLLERKKNAASRQALPPRTEETNAIPRFLAEVWPMFIDNEPAPYWSSPWEPLSLCAPTTSVSGDFELMGMSAGHLQSIDAANIGLNSAQANVAHDRPHDTQLSTSQTAAFSYSSSSLSSALSEPQSGEQEIEAIVEEEHIVLSDVRTGLSQGVGLLDVDHIQVDSDFRGDSIPTFDAERLDNTVINDHQQVTVNETETTDLTSCVEPATDDTTDHTVCSEPGHGCSHTLGSDSNSPMASSVAHSQLHVINSPSHHFVNSFTTRRRQRVIAETPSDLNIRISLINVSRDPKPQKLSSKLPVTSDPSVLAYVCGHSICWPDTSAASAARFATSGELSTHFKNRHLDDPDGDEETPFRCGLKGCNKAWKSVNGLQYHLQISKAHYRRALSTAISTPQKSTDELEARVDATPQTEASKPVTKPHKCPYTDCPNEYKQLSGLRYHLRHGHPKNPPTQLEFVPPTIARKFGVDIETVSF